MDLLGVLLLASALPVDCEAGVATSVYESVFVELEQLGWGPPFAVSEELSTMPTGARGRLDAFSDAFPGGAALIESLAAKVESMPPRGSTLQWSSPAESSGIQIVDVADCGSRDPALYQACWERIRAGDSTGLYWRLSPVVCNDTGDYAAVAVSFDGGAMSGAGFLAVSRRAADNWTVLKMIRTWVQ
jgi:hypothetical protein